MEAASPPKPADLDQARQAKTGEPNGKADDPSKLEGAGDGENPEAGGEGDGEQAKPKAPPLEIESGRKQLTLNVGGEEPSTSQVKLRGGSIGVKAGEFKKGEFVNLLVRARCSEVDLVDKIDSQTGEVTETIRRHVFRPVHVEKVAD